VIIARYFRRQEEKEAEITGVSHTPKLQKDHLQAGQELNCGENGTAVSETPPPFQV